MTDLAGTYPFGRAEPYPRTTLVVADAQKQHDAARAERSAASAIKHIALRVDPAQMRNVHRELAQRLAREAGLRVSLAKGRAAIPLPSSVDLLLQLERLVFRLAGRKLGDRLEFDQTLTSEHPANEPPDLVFDFCGDEADPGERTIRILYDGMAGDVVLIGALVAGRMPMIELEAARSGRVLARGVPCADNAGSITEALECVLARLVTLALAVARGNTT
jgi:hypothetical protein